MTSHAYQSSPDLLLHAAERIERKAWRLFVSTALLLVGVLEIGRRLLPQPEFPATLFAGQFAIACLAAIVMWRIAALRKRLHKATRVRNQGRKADSLNSMPDETWLIGAGALIAIAGLSIAFYDLEHGLGFSVIGAGAAFALSIHVLTLAGKYRSECQLEIAD